VCLCACVCVCVFVCMCVCVYTYVFACVHARAMTGLDVSSKYRGYTECVVGILTEKMIGPQNEFGQRLRRVQPCACWDQCGQRRSTGARDRCPIYVQPVLAKTAQLPPAFPASPRDPERDREIARARDIVNTHARAHNIEN